LRLVDAAVIPIAERATARSDARSAATPGIYVVCNSVYSSESILRAYGVQAHVLYPGVDTDRFRPAPSAFDAPADRNYVLSVGRLDPAKNYHLVVQALGMLEPVARPALHVVADQRPMFEYEEAVGQLARDLGVDLTVVSPAHDDQLIAEYQHAVATICAAELEPFGLTSIESIACGTAVVAVRQGGFREVVEDGVNGFLVDASPAGLAAGISRAVSHRGRFDSNDLHNWVTEHEWTWADAADRLDRHVHCAIEAQSSAT
jgi:glycosyltransferase involved in cell wall biosynthesis